MNMTIFKIAGLSIMAVGLTAGAAWAGGGKDCKDKKHTAMKTETTMTPATAVLNASERTAKTRKVYTFEQALEKCQAKGASDLQACIDYKTGKIDKPLS